MNPAVFPEKQSHEHAAEMVFAEDDHVVQALPPNAPDEALHWAHVPSAGTQARVTLIAADGRVPGDSVQPASGLENHAGRPEIPLTPPCI